MIDQTVKLIDHIVAGIHEKKGQSIVLLDLREIGSSTFDFFIVCQGSSTTQVAAIGDEVMRYVNEHLSLKPYGYDGYTNQQWIVIDYGNVLVHVFHPESRTHYQIESLWADAKFTQIKDIE